jgi:hypothetical protein
VFTPSNGLKPNLLDAETAADVTFAVGTRIDTDTGLVQDAGGTPIDVRTSSVAQVGGPPIRVFEGQSFHISFAR